MIFIFNLINRSKCRCFLRPHALVSWIGDIHERVIFT